jgi:hypothetical protein
LPVTAAPLGSTHAGTVAVVYQYTCVGGINHAIVPPHTQVGAFGRRYFAVMRAEATSCKLLEFFFTPMWHWRFVLSAVEACGVLLTGWRRKRERQGSLAANAGMLLAWKDHEYCIRRTG